MLGLQDNSIFAAYMLSIVSALSCIVYGILNWNKGGNDEAKEIREEQQWESEEEKLNGTM
jgi:hypothetical protein